VVEEAAPAPAPAPTAAPATEGAKPEVTAPAAKGAAAPNPTPGRPGLPTRKRQSHVAPELRETPNAAAQDSPADTAAIETFTVADDAAAQRARSRMSAFQRGTVGGRADGVDGRPHS
jgi:hypothetical protein